MACSRSGMRTSSTAISLPLTRFDTGHCPAQGDWEPVRHHARDLYSGRCGDASGAATAGGRVAPTGEAAWHWIRWAAAADRGLAQMALGDVLRERNELDAAMHSLRIGIALARQWGIHVLLVDSTIALARLKQACGDGDGGLR